MEHRRFYLHSRNKKFIYRRTISQVYSQERKNCLLPTEQFLVFLKCKLEITGNNGNSIDNNSQCVNSLIYNKM